MQWSLTACILMRGMVTTTGHCSELVSEGNEAAWLGWE